MQKALSSTGGCIASAGVLSHFQQFLRPADLFRRGGNSICLLYTSGEGDLVILKAFTKLYGMAGVRLGYALSADTALLEQMQACGQPWGVSSPVSYTHLRSGPAVPRR